MQIIVTPQEAVQHHGPVNRMKYGGWLWESGKSNPQTTKDEDQKDIPRAGMGTPHPRTGPVGGNDWHTTCKVKDWCRDDGRIPKHTHSETVKKDQKVCLYGRTMIIRIRSHPRKHLKRRSIRDRYRPTSKNFRDQEGANRSGG
jgi:hypothetical protein